MKKKGFTLIELIVVIAIIGVLAAILVPAMLGYVRKSKITTANTTAKSIYNAFNTALVDLDTVDETGFTFATTASGGDLDGSSWGTSSDKLQSCVYGYFTDIVKVKKFAVTNTDGACTAAGVLNGKYPGAYPNQWTVETYKSATNKPTTAVAAMAGPTAKTT